jgi:hypothetical protein
MIDEENPHTAVYVRAFAEQANKQQVAMRGMTSKERFQHVKAILAENDVVVGVFQEPTVPYGVGTSLIKGEETLERIMKSGVAERLRVNAIPCIDLEQAVAARKVLGTH